MTFWNSEKSSNLKAHELSWTFNELCTRILIVPSSCPPIDHVHRWTLWKNHPSAVFSSKMKQKQQKRTKQNNTKQKRHKQATRQRKLEISSYNIQL